VRYATREARRDKHHYGYDSHDPTTTHSKRTSGAPSSNLALKRSLLSVHNGTITHSRPTSGKGYSRKFVQKMPPQMQAHSGGQTQVGSSLRREKFSAGSRNIQRFGPESRSVSLEPGLASHRSIPKQKAAASEAATKEAIQPTAALRDASCWITAMTATLKKAQKAVMMSSPKYVSDSVEAMAASSVGTLGTMTMYGSLFTIAVVRALLPSRSRSARG
jgi:hypothetical protein